MLGFDKSHHGQTASYTKYDIGQMRRTVLITGGAGFLGSQLCDVYIARDYRVICLDDLSTGRLSNIGHLLDHPSFEFVEQDVIEPFQPKGCIDLIFNMACPASPPKYQRDPIHTFKTNIQGAENMLRLAHKHGARILQASTSEIYGDPEISPQSESYHGNVNTLGPRSCYDEGKRAAETLFYDFRQQYGVDARIARIFNTYGPRMDPGDGRVVSNFVTQVLRGDDITIYGDGSQTRSFCFVDDLIQGLCALIHLPKSPGQPVNLGNPEEFTIRELAEIVIEETHKDAQIVYKDLPVDDPRQRRPDIRLAHQMLNWRPQFTLREGLRSTIPYFMAELSRNSAPSPIAAQ